MPALLLAAEFFSNAEGEGSPGLPPPSHTALICIHTVLAQCHLWSDQLTSGHLPEGFSELAVLLTIWWGDTSGTSSSFLGGTCWTTPAFCSCSSDLLTGVCVQP